MTKKHKIIKFCFVSEYSAFLGVLAPENLIKNYLGILLRTWGKTQCAKSTKYKENCFSANASFMNES